MKILINHIAVKDNRRTLSEKTIKELMDSINEVGLLNPVTIDEDSVLIAGAHRLEAIKRLGWGEIDCNVISGLDELQRRMAELDENIIRNEGSFVERGEWLAERKQIYEIIYPETKREAYLKQNRNDNLSQRETKSFCQDTAEKTGVSERTIQREIQMAKDIIPEVKEIIKEAAIPKSNALEIARMDEEKQRQIFREVEALKLNNPSIPKEEAKELVKSIVEQNISERERILKKEFKDIDEKYRMSQAILGALNSVNDLKLLDINYAVRSLIETGDRTKIYPHTIIEDARDAILILQDIVDKVRSYKDKEEVDYAAH